MVCYAEKQEKPFWFSSLDQIVHFDAIMFCRTFVELFWSVRVDRKKNKRVTIIVAFHFMKRRLKINSSDYFRSNRYTFSHWTLYAKQWKATPLGFLWASVLSEFKGKDEICNVEPSFLCKTFSISSKPLFEEHLKAFLYKFPKFAAIFSNNFSMSRVSRPGRSKSDHIMAPYKSYKFTYYDLAMIGLESYMVHSMVRLKA